MVDRDLVLAKARPSNAASLASTRRAREPHSKRSIARTSSSSICSAPCRRCSTWRRTVVAREGVGVPDDLAASFEILRRAGVLDEDLADHMRRMSGFRNLAVHECRKPDPKIVDAIVRERLGDLRAFARAILERFRI